MDRGCHLSCTLQQKGLHLLPQLWQHKNAAHSAAVQVSWGSPELNWAVHISNVSPFFYMSLILAFRKLVSTQWRSTSPTRAVSLLFLTEQCRTPSAVWYVHLAEIPLIYLLRSLRSVSTANLTRTRALKYHYKLCRTSFDVKDIQWFWSGPHLDLHQQANPHIVLADLHILFSIKPPSFPPRAVWVKAVNIAWLHSPSGFHLNRNMSWSFWTSHPAFFWTAGTAPASCRYVICTSPKQSSCL